MFRGSFRFVNLLIAIAVIAAACGGASLAANAGSDFSVGVGESPSFDGCDSAGDIAGYEWLITAAPPAGADAVGVILGTGADCQSVIDPMTTSDIGTWTIELTVFDADGEASTDSVDVTVTE